jgi:hypothetical protein
MGRAEHGGLQSLIGIALILIIGFAGLHTLGDFQEFRRREQVPQEDQRRPG